MPKPPMAERDGIHYYVEELPGHRGQLVADVVVDGRRNRSYRFGSPAPLDRVRAAATQLNRFRNPRPGAELSSEPRWPHGSGAGGRPFSQPVKTVGVA